MLSMNNQCINSEAVAFPLETMMFSARGKKYVALERLCYFIDNFFFFFLCCSISVCTCNVICVSD